MTSIVEKLRFAILNAEICKQRGGDAFWARREAYWRKQVEAIREQNKNLTYQRKP